MDIEPRQQKEEISQSSNNHGQEASNLDIKSNSEPAKFKPHKRREINEEKKQITSLFTELMILINQQALAADGVASLPLLEQLPKKAKSAVSQTELKRKNAKINRNQKDMVIAPKQIEKQKGVVESQSMLAVPKMNTSEVLRKSSFAYKQSNQAEHVELEERKKEIFENYSYFMSYKIHESEEEMPIDKNTNVAHMPPQDSTPIIKSSANEERKKLCIARCFEMVVATPIVGVDDDIIKIEDSPEKPQIQTLPLPNEKEAQAAVVKEKEVQKQEDHKMDVEGEGYGQGEKDGKQII